MISYPREGCDQPGWEIVQVDMEDDSWMKAKTTGKYHVKFWLRNAKDAKTKRVRECRYWPNIHEFKRDRRSLGPLCPIRPQVALETLRKKKGLYFWYQDTIMLEECLVVGPFNFIQGYYIPDTVWTLLITRAPSRNIYIEDINQVISLEEKNEGGQGFVSMSLAWSLDDIFSPI